MEFQNEVFSKILSIEDYKNKFEEVIRILDKQNFKEVEILFGVAWGSTYKDWTPFKVPLCQVAPEIQLAEQLGEGRFGDDDFYIIVYEPQLEILFCHERDIHLRYNLDNLLAIDILARWNREDLINAIKRSSG